MSNNSPYLAIKIKRSNRLKFLFDFLSLTVPMNRLVTLVHPPRWRGTAQAVTDDAKRLPKSEGIENFSTILSSIVPEDRIVSIAYPPLWRGTTQGVSHDVERATRLLTLKKQIANSGLDIRSRIYNRKSKRALFLYFHYSRMARQTELLFSKYSSDTHLIVWNGVKDYRGIAAAIARKRL